MKKTAESSVTFMRKDFITKSETIKDAYDVSAKALATGTYGAVHQCTHKITKVKRAVKIIPKYKMTDICNFLDEIELLKTVDHPHIIRIYEWFEDKNNVYVVMEMCEGGELFDKLTNEGHLSEALAANLFKDMMSAVNYCYSKKICHRDLKPENFMFVSKDTSSEIKLIDFGLSQIFEDSSINLVCNVSNRSWQD